MDLTSIACRYRECDAVHAFVNAAFMGAGAKVWNPWTLAAGALAAALILPVF
jgi:hypothetical protein